MTRTIRPALLPLATLLLSGCAAVVANQYRSSAYVNSEVRSVSTMPVEVHGGPPAETVVSAMTASAVGLRRFVPAGQGGNLYRVVWRFGTGVGHPDAVCAGGGPTTGEELSAALCRGITALTYATGRLTPETQPGGPAFRGMIQTMTMALFPADDGPLLRRD